MAAYLFPKFGEGAAVPHTVSLSLTFEPQCVQNIFFHLFPIFFVPIVLYYSTTHTGKLSIGNAKIFPLSAIFIRFCPVSLFREAI